MSTPIEWRARPGEARSARSAETAGGSNVPLVSIGMPSYNSGRFIRQSLESLLTQAYERIELIVSDDGSTDETPEVCAELARADPRIVMVDSTHRGERQNFNTVLRLARGKYFMWAADHDLWDASYLSRCVAALEEDKGAVLAYARSALIDTEGRVVPEMDDALGITQERPIDRYRSLISRLENCNAIYGLMRCELLKGTGGYGPYPAPDHLVLAKMALQGTFVQVPRTLYFRRQNRPPETGEDQRRRQSFDLDPVEASKWLSRPERDYFRTLRDAHLAAVLAAPISVSDKVLGLTATVACFRQRFGVRSRLWAGAGKILDRIAGEGRRGLPARVRAPDSFVRADRGHGLHRRRHRG
jgi:hypothetical protein